MILTAHVKPGAKQNKIEWLDPETIKIWVTAIAQKGSANTAVLELLAQELNLAKSRLRLIRGKTTRLKQIKID